MKRIEKLRLLLRYPRTIIFNGINSLNEELFRSRIKEKYGLEQLPTVDITEIIPDFQEELSTYSFLEGTSLITDIILLKSLARGHRNCHYLEIGSWRGESIINVSEIAESCISITLSEDELRQKNFSEDVIRVHGVYSKNAKNIRTIKHNSYTYDFTKLKERFDLIFIDGDHSYIGVLSDTKKVFNLRKSSDSVIVWHDYGYSTESVKPSVLAAILDGIPVDKHNNLYHVSNTMCAVYIENQKFKTYHTKFPTYPDKKFSVKVMVHKI
jgi:predicted O-methyltransferase YrrM